MKIRIQFNPRALYIGADFDVPGMALVCVVPMIVIVIRWGAFYDVQPSTPVEAISRAMLDLGKAFGVMNVRR